MSEIAAAGPIKIARFRPPYPQDKLRPRRHLLPRVFPENRKRLLLLIAPAGYGKTSLAMQSYALCLERRADAVWLGLDAEHDDHACFLAHLIDCIRQRNPHFGQATRSLLANVSVAPSILRTILTNEIAALSPDLYLFLDGYGDIADGEIARTINELLLVPNERLYICITARSSGTLPLSQLLVQGQLEEIGLSELRFSKAEAYRFCQSSATRELLDDNAFNLLFERSEGWPAALHIAMQALRDSDSPALACLSFSGEHKHVASFLNAEAFARQPQQVRDFLLKTSLLERFNAPLCAAVTGIQDSRQILNQIRESNLFVIPLDDNHAWYRYHRMMSAFLRKHLRETDAGSLYALHCLACDWLERNGLQVEAIDHALAMNNIDRAASLIDVAAENLFTGGQVATLHRYVKQLPVKMVERLPRLQLELAWDYEVTLKFRNARAALDHVRAFLQTQEFRNHPEMGGLSAKLDHREMMLDYLSDNLGPAHGKCVDWLRADTTPDPYMVASARTALVHMQTEAFAWSDSLESLEALRNTYLNADIFYGTVFHDCIIGRCLYLRGHIAEAEASYRAAHEIAARLNGKFSALANMPLILLAEIHYETNRLEQARQLVRQYLKMPMTLCLADNLIAQYVTRAKLAYLDGGLERSEEVFEEAAQAVSNYGFQRLEAYITAEKVRQLLKGQKLQLAKRLIRSGRWSRYLAQPLPNDTATTTHCLIALSQARILAAEGDTPAAKRILRSWLKFASGRKSLNLAILAGVILACVLLQEKDNLGASRALIGAIDADVDGSMLRTFIDEGAEIHTALIALYRSQDQSKPRLSDRLRTMLGALGQAEDDTPAAPPAVGEFTEQEIRIIALASQSMTNKDIARMVNVTENTVKWYLKRIYAKLHTHRKYQAITLARRMRLIQ